MLQLGKLNEHFELFGKLCQNWATHQPTDQYTYALQTWKKWIFVRKAIFSFEKCPQIQIIPKHIKLPWIAIFPRNWIFSYKNELIVDRNVNLWALSGKNCQKYVVDQWWVKVDSSSWYSIISLLKSNTRLSSITTAIFGFNESSILE